MEDGCEECLEHELSRGQPDDQLLRLDEFLARAARAALTKSAP
jgi:hypothetical protein